MIVKVRSHTVYQQKDGQYKCEVWYIDETGKTKRTTHTHPSQSSINKFLKKYPDGEYYPVCTLNEFFDCVYLNVLKETAKSTNYLKLVSLYNLKIRPVIGDKQMKILKKGELTKFLEGIADNWCHGTVVDCYRMLQRMFTHYSISRDVFLNNT